MIDFDLFRAHVKRRNYFTRGDSLTHSLIRSSLVPTISIVSRSFYTECFVSKGSYIQVRAVVRRLLRRVIFEFGG